MADGRFGSKADILASQRDVRFTPESGHLQCIEVRPLWAKSELVRCSKQHLYLN